MSFLRPEAAAKLRRYAEPLIWAILLIVFAWMAAGRMGNGQWFPAAIFGALALVAGLGFTSGLLRAHLVSAGTAKGVVLIDERRIGYFGPESGGFVDLADLRQLDLHHEVWRLIAVNGDVIEIPTDAPKAEALLDLFATLPGVSLVMLHAALTRPESAFETIWARPN